MLLQLDTATRSSDVATFFDAQGEESQWPPLRGLTNSQIFTIQYWISFSNLLSAKNKIFSFKILIFFHPFCRLLDYVSRDGRTTQPPRPTYLRPDQIPIRAENLWGVASGKHLHSDCSCTLKHLVSWFRKGKSMSASLRPISMPQ
jgi:hypothetical protein